MDKVSSSDIFTASKSFLISLIALSSSLNEPLSFKLFIKSLTLLSSLFRMLNNNLSKLLDICISILGDNDGLTLSGLYSPVLITLCKISFSFVATMSLLMGKPIFLAT